MLGAKATPMPQSVTVLPFTLTLTLPPSTWMPSSWQPLTVLPWISVFL